MNHLFPCFLSFLLIITLIIPPLQVFGQGVAGSPEGNASGAGTGQPAGWGGGDATTGSGPSASSPAGGAQAAGGYTDGSRDTGYGDPSVGQGPGSDSPAGGAQAAGGYTDGSRDGGMTREEAYQQIEAAVREGAIGALSDQDFGIRFDSPIAIPSVPTIGPGVLDVGSRPGTWSGPKGPDGLSQAAYDAFSRADTNADQDQNEAAAVNNPPQTANQLTVNARMAAAGFNPDGSVQRAVTIDYGKLMSVTTGRVSDYQANGTFDSKIAMEQNLIGMALNSNLDQAQLGRVNPGTISRYGAIDNRDTNGAFAKSLDSTVAPGLWSDSNTTGKEQLAVSYLSNIIGYTPAQAAGMVGNFKAESGLDHLEEAAGSERSSGLAQWNAARAAGERRQALETYAGTQFSAQLAGGRHTSGPGPFTQMAFAAAEMNGTVIGYRDRGAEAVGRSFQNNPDMTAEEAAREFQDRFERPADRTYSLGARQSGARAALDSYYAINPEQKNFTVDNRPDPQTAPPDAPKGTRESDDRTPARAEFGLGGIKVTVNPTRAFDALRDLTSRFFGNNTDGDKYTSLPMGTGEGQIVPTLEQVIVTPGRPIVCPAGSDDQGFAFAVKLSNKSQHDRAHSCNGQTTADYFFVIAAYLRVYGIYDIREAEVLQKMQIISQ